MQQFRIIVKPGENILVNIDEIEYFEGARNYTRIHLTHNRVYMQSTGLCKYEECLKDLGLFVRIHKKYLVARRYFNEMSLELGSVQVNATALPISRRRQETLRP